MPHPETCLKTCPQGLFSEPGGFFIDPVRVVDRAIITHDHSDHARPGNRAVLATPETLAVMQARLGERAGGSLQALGYGAPIHLGEVDVLLAPAGHVLGSAQVVMEYRGSRAVVSGKPAMIRELVAARTDPVLFEWSYDYVGDLAETVAMIRPGAPGNAAPPSFAEVVEARATGSPASAVSRKRSRPAGRCGASSP